MHTLVDNIQTFLLNIFLTYFCFSIYFKFIELKTSKLTSEFIIALVSGISIILCMTFPITLSPGFLTDFRQAPFIIGALYGGRRVALSLLFTLLAYRFYLDLPHFETIAVVYFFLFVSLWYLIPKFHEIHSIKSKLYLASLASLFGLIVRTGLVLKLRPDDFTLDLFVFILCTQVIQTVGIMLFVFLNEKSRKDAILTKEINKFEKLKTVSTLAASISHEVRNPLTVTKGFVQLLREPGLAEQDKNEYIKTALESLEKAEGIITDYLTFAKPSLENIELLDLHKELTNLKNMTEPYAMMNNVEMEMSLEKNIYIAGEKEKVHQCLINIMKNGIEAMPKGGKLKLRLDRLEDNAMVTVADSGIGMNKEQVDRLGNPFFTTKDIGTGLGTMVVYSVVKSMDGTIHVDSQPGNGTRFSIILPVAEHSLLPVEEAIKPDEPSFL